MGKATEEDCLLHLKLVVGQALEVGNCSPTGGHELNVIKNEN